MPLMQMTVYGCTLLLCWLGAQAIINYNLFGGGIEMGTGELTALLNYTMQILMSLMGLSMIFLNIIMSRASAERVCEVLDEVASIQSPENAVSQIENGDIEFRDVDFAYYEGKNVLHKVNLKINSGETVGIIGGTGSTKST